MYVQVILPTPCSPHTGRTALSGEAGNLPLTVRRGHFCNYTRALSGRTKGIFWFSDTTIGNKENGTIDKQYRIGG